MSLGDRQRCCCTRPSGSHPCDRCARKGSVNTQARVSAPRKLTSTRRTFGMADADAGNAAAINSIIRWLARRDLPSLARGVGPASWGGQEADAILLLGGISQPEYAETVAAAIRDGAAPCVILVGGVGHSTPRLRAAVAAHSRFGDIATDGRAEAEILFDILTRHLGVPASAVALCETASTNCGNNATLALAGLRASGRPHPERVILVQDPLMMRRSHESFAHEWRDTGCSFASWAPEVPLLQPSTAISSTAGLEFVDARHASVWGLEPFLELVMGEVPRLRPDGYGPRGKGFIGHVDVPEHVQAAFDALLGRFGGRVRAARESAV